MKILIQKIFILSLTLLFVCPRFTWAQAREDSTKKQSTIVQKLTTKDGNILYGRIIKSTKDEITFETKNIGTVKVKLSNVAKIEAVTKGSPTEKRTNKQVTRGDRTTWYRHQMNVNKYFISPTGYNLEKNDVYIEDTYLFLLSGRWGITKNISVGGGISWIPGVSLDKQMYFINPKVTLPIAKNLNIGATFSWFRIPDVGELGFLNVAATYGTHDYNISAGVSYGVADGQMAAQPLVTFGAMVRPINRLALVGEVLLFPTQVVTTGQQDFTPFTILGVRFINAGSSFDLGFVYANDEQNGSRTELLFVPYLSYRHSL